MPHSFTVLLHPDDVNDATIVPEHQTPHLTKTSSLRADMIFLSYPAKDNVRVRLSDEEYIAAARKRAEETLLIPREEIREDWSCDSEDTYGHVEYQLLTREWIVYPQMQTDGRYSWCGIYRR